MNNQCPKYKPLIYIHVKLLVLQTIRTYFKYFDLDLLWNITSPKPLLTSTHIRQSVSQIWTYSKPFKRYFYKQYNRNVSILTMTLVMPGIQKLPCHQITSGKYCQRIWISSVKKNVRVVDITLVMPGIQKLPCHQITSGKYCQRIWISSVKKKCKSSWHNSIQPYFMYIRPYHLTTRLCWLSETFYHLHTVGNHCTKYESPL